MRILHTMLRVGDLERAIDFYSSHGRRSLDKAFYFRAYGFLPSSVALNAATAGVGGHVTNF